MDDAKLQEMENQIILLRHSFDVLKDAALLDGFIDDREAAMMEELELKILEAERLCDQRRSELLAEIAEGDRESSQNKAEAQSASAETPPNTSGGGSILGSVGKGGKNGFDDVSIVQGLLNRHGASLTIDGDCGSKTKSAIASFQASRLGSSDGRVDPGGQTWAALNGNTGSPIHSNTGDTESGEILGALGEIAEDLVETVSDSIPEPLSEVGDAIGDTVKSVTDSIGEAAQGLFDDEIDEDEALEELQRITSSYDDVIKELETL